MGQRVVLLSFADQLQAEEFVRLVARTNGVLADCPFTPEDDEDPEAAMTHPSKFFSATIEAVVARPTSWCRCGVPLEARTRSQLRRSAKRKEQSWQRGRTLGWWLCSNCHRPSRPVVKLWITNMLGGANDLLPQILGTGPVRSPQDRWRDEMGVANPHSLGAPTPVLHQQMADVTVDGAPIKRRTNRKPRIRRV